MTSLAGDEGLTTRAAIILTFAEAMIFPLALTAWHAALAPAMIESERWHRDTGVPEADVIGVEWRGR